MSATVEDQRDVQRMGALERANTVRLDGAAIRADIAHGMPVAEALDDPRSGSLTILRLLMAQHRWGRDRAVRLLSRCAIPENKRVRDMTDRQRRIVAEALG